MASEPSDYERSAWEALHRQGVDSGVGGQLRKARQKFDMAGRRMMDHVGNVSERMPAIGRARDRAIKVASGARDRVPIPVTQAATRSVETATRVFEGGARALNRAGALAFRPKRIVKLHRRLGHPVERLSDVRQLDLEQVDAVKTGWLDLGYEVAAAMVGAGSGLAITGGELATGVTGGAAAAPSAGVIASALAADAAATFALSSAVANHIAGHYGYDPSRPEERLFVLAAINFGTAATAGAKGKAYADLSRLTQSLYRNAPWAKLNEVSVAKVAQAFAVRFNVRLTKRALGRFVPFAGVAAGAGLNWLTLEQVADATDLAYRRRFLLDKYPQLAESEVVELPVIDDPVGGGSEDEEVSVLDLLDENTEEPRDS